VRTGVAFVAQTWLPAIAGIHLSTLTCQECGRNWTSTVSTNSSRWRR